MRFYNVGVNENSYIYFFTPSQTAKRLLYYPKVVGEFCCNEKYCVKRDNYDSVLALYVKEGQITLEQDDKIVIAKSGELLLIDCYKAHKYYCDSYAKTLWVHFDGCESGAWLKEICSSKGQKLKANTGCVEGLIKIIDGVKNGENELNLSESVYSFLCQLLIAKNQEEQTINYEWIGNAVRYIKENLENDITVEDMAKEVHLSSSYFAKTFKQATGVSPYDYLLNLRIEKAKELLIKTNLPISIVASRCGFNSESNFIFAFKKCVSYSPLKFRKTKY